MSGLSILILAAGRSTRMRGTDKLLQEVQGQPVLRYLATEALGLNLPVLVTLPGDTTSSARKRSVSGLGIQVVEVADPDAGMAASVVAGITALPPGCTGAMLVLGDMPEVTRADMTTLAMAFNAAGGATVVRGATASGTPGHPVIFPARMFPELRRLDGDKGARDLLAAEDAHLVPLPGQHAVLDLDTPEDWATWRKTQT